MIKGRIPDPKEAEEYFRAKLAFTAGPAELISMLETDEEIVIVDVRSQEDFEQSRIPGAISLPKEKWSSAHGLKKTCINIFYSYNPDCLLAAKAAYKFSALGYPAMELHGGISSWRQLGYKEEVKGEDAAYEIGQTFMRH